MSSIPDKHTIFDEINKIKIKLSPTQVAELSKFPVEVISYVNSCSQNFITFDIIHRQCRTYASMKNYPLNTQLRDQILEKLRKREERYAHVSRKDYLEKYNMLFNDDVKDERDN